MKQLLLIAFFALSLLACSKDKDSKESLTSDHFVIFKANGQLIKIQGEFSQQLSQGVRAIRTASGSDLGIDGNNNDASLMMLFSPDSVRSGQTYVLGDNSLGNGVGLSFKGKHYLTVSPRTTPQYHLTVHVTKHFDGWISGTFSGKLGHKTSNGSAWEEITLTEGVFRSKVVYYR